MRLLGLIIILFNINFTQAKGNIKNCSNVKNEEILNCIKLRYKKADNKLNLSYKASLSILDKNQKKLFVDTQRIWIRYKESYCDSYVSELTENKGRESEIEKYTCLWSTTDVRNQEIQRLKHSIFNDMFLNVILSLESIGYSKSELITKLKNRFLTDQFGWNEYLEKNCLLSHLINDEDIQICRARLNAQRGNY